MRYSLGESLADFGFNFLEKLHEPIFLVNRVGKLIQVNEAGRKFLNVTRWTSLEMENYLRATVMHLFRMGENSIQRISLSKNGRQLIARSFEGSDLVLIEVV